MTEKRGVKVSPEPVEEINKLEEKRKLKLKQKVFNTEVAKDSFYMFLASFFFGSQSKFC